MSMPQRSHPVTRNAEGDEFDHWRTQAARFADHAVMHKRSLISAARFAEIAQACAAVAELYRPKR